MNEERKKGRIAILMGRIYHWKEMKGRKVREGILIKGKDMLLP